MDSDRNRSEEPESGRQHPQVREHPEQRRQDETGREDPTDPQEIGEPPSRRGDEKKPQRVA